MATEFAKKFKELKAEATKAGWRVEERTGSWFLYPPDKSKPIVNVAKTPSDHRAWKNIMARMRKSGWTK